MAKETLDGLRQRAQKALSQGQYQQSCQFFQQALALGPDAPELHYGLATVYFLLSELDLSAQHFKEAIRTDPRKAGAYINLGAVYNRLGHYEEAIQLLRRGIQLDTNRAEGYYNLGLVYRQLGQLDLAIQAYREATRVNPRMADAHYNVGNIFLEKEQYALANAHYCQALEIRPDWEKARSALETVQSLQAPPEAPRPAEEPRTRSGRTLDPGRLLDPNVHGPLLRDMHQLVIEMDGHGRKLLEILLEDVEEAIRGLSNALLFPDNPAYNLTEHLHKVELVMGQLQRLQQSIHKRVHQIQQMGEHLVQI